MWEVTHEKEGESQLKVSWTYLHCSMVYIFVTQSPYEEYHYYLREYILLNDSPNALQIFFATYKKHFSFIWELFDVSYVIVTMNSSVL